MFFMDSSASLKPTNKQYEKALTNYVWEAYRMDTSDGDVTTKYFLGRVNGVVQASIKANEEGIFAGAQEAKWLLDKIGIKIIQVKKEGVKIEKGEIVMHIEGVASKILAAERTLLNLLQRMSGVATKAKKLSTKTPKGIQLLCTRKTLWGLLDKRAASLGGAKTHRLNLGDAVLVKENHLTLAPNFKQSLKRTFKKLSKVKFVEIELESKKEVEAFIEAYGKFKRIVKDEKGIVVMLDNFSPKAVKEVVAPLKKLGVYVELSGGINERSISRYNIAGVSAISSGAITTKAPNLDFSMRVSLCK